MPAGFYTDPDEEEAAVARSRQAWDRILAARQSATRADAQAISTLSANYPHMSPGTVVPLAQAGVAPDDPLAQHVATEEAKSNKRKRGFFGGLGDIVQGGFSGLMFLPELGMGVVRNIASAGGNIAAGAVSGAAVGGSVGLFAGGIGALPGAIGGAIVGAGAGAVAEMRGVEVEGGFVNPLEQTTLGQDIFYGKSQGGGLLPGGTAVEAQAEAARRSASVSGHALTPGRYLAHTVLEPGTTPYNLISGAMDAAVAWKLDPIDVGLKMRSATKARHARFLPSDKELAARVAGDTGAAAPVTPADDFEDFVAAEDARTLARQDAGLVDGARRTIIGEKVDAWLGTKEGLRAQQWFADNDFETIRKGLGGNKVDVETVRQLADATTLDEVDAILRPKLGIAGGMETKPRVGSFGMEVKRKAAELPFFEKVAQSRLWKDLPTGRIDYTDPTEATHQFDLMARDANIHLDPNTDLTTQTRRFAEALLEGTFEGNRKADMIIYETFGGARGAVAQSDAGRAFMNKVHRRAGADDMDVLRGLIDEDATKMPSEHLSINGKTHNLPAASYLTDYLDTGVSIDRNTIRGIRAATSRYARVMNNGGIQTGTTFLAHVTDDIWKPTALLRGAWTVRVVGEEQIRMAASGRLSLFNHPISYLAWAMDDTGAITNIFKKHGIKLGGRGQVDVTGEAFAAKGTITPEASDALEAELRDAAHGHFGQAVNSKMKAEAWAGDGFTEAGHKETFHRGAPGHVEAVAENIDNAFADPLLSQLAARPRHEVREWLIRGDGDAIRQRLIKNGAPLRTDAEIDKALDAAQKELDRIIGKVSDRGQVPAAALTGAGVDPATQQAMQAGRRASRPGSPAIREAIANGQLNGVPIRDAKGNINREFIRELDALADDLPDKIVGSAARQDARWAAKRDKGIQTLYTHLMTKPSAKLSRSPMFRQTYWEEARNLVTEMDPAAQQKLLDSAVAAKLPKADIEAIRTRISASSGDLTLNEVDMVAKGRALDQTQSLLYDAAHRGQMTDVLRIIMPFAEAQKEVMTVWARVGLVDNPAVLNKARKVISAARGAGYFYKDPSTNEEMFVFPGSELITDKLLGMPIPLTGRVQGLNTFGTSVIPGMGPAVQIPTRFFLPDKPQFDGIREMIDPFGASAGETEGILEQQFPGWLTSIRKAFADPESDRAFGNAVKDTWAQGVSAGRYSTETPEDIRNGLDHAKSTARWLYIIRAGAMLGGAPTPPSPKFQAMDKHGKWHMAKALSEDYRAMMDDPNIGFDGANAAFVEKYGVNAAAFMQSKTYSTVPSAPATGDFREWTKTGEAQQLREKYGDVYALFGPQGEGFDYTQYLRNIQSGDTQTLTPEQFVEQTNNRQAQMIYYNFKDRFGPTPSKAQRQWLADLRVKLRERFPGYDIPLPGKPDARTVKQQFIPQIEQAIKDPALANSDIATATRAYLTVRAQAEAAAEAAGYGSFDQAKGAAPMRAWLRQVLDRLVQRTPDFAPMAERIFDREMKDDDQPEEALPEMPV